MNDEKNDNDQQIEIKSNNNWHISNCAKID